MNLCEWNPTTGSPATLIDHQYVGCGNIALVELGSGIDNWHLCRSCAVLPRFRNLRSKAYLDPRLSRTVLRQRHTADIPVSVIIENPREDNKHEGEAKL